MTRNPFVWGALALCAGLLLAVAYVPALAAVLGLEAPGAEGWALVLVLGALPVVLGPMIRAGVTRVDERAGGTERAR